MIKLQEYQIMLNHRNDKKKHDFLLNCTLVI